MSDAPTDAVTVESAKGPGHPAPGTGRSPEAPGRSGAQPGDRSEDDAARADTLTLLGLLAHTELSAFSRLAADAALAPTLDQRLQLSRLAAAELGHLEEVLGRVAELGATAEAAMAPFRGVLVDFDARTVEQTWWERLLKAYVGYSVADDFCRLAARGLDERSRSVVEHALGDTGHAELVVAALEQAAQEDPTLASRLALWGRRVVGEALNVVQQATALHPGLTRLVARSEGTYDQARVFAELTAAHTRRMERLGLTA